MISQYDEAEGKKAEETKRERGGLLPPPLPRCFSFCSIFFSPSPSSERLEQAIVALLVCDRKKEGHQNYDCLIRGSRPEEIIVLFARF